MSTRNQALSIIILRSLEASEYAVKALRSTSEKGTQINYNYAAQSALSDSKAELTEIERALITSFIKEPEEIKRGFSIRVRVTGEELDQLKKDAFEARTNLSNYVRTKALQSS